MIAGVTLRLLRHPRRANVSSGKRWAQVRSDVGPRGVTEYGRNRAAGCREAFGRALPHGRVARRSER